MDDLGDITEPYSPLSPRIVVFDALLADLETTTSLISKHPVLLTDPPGPRNLDPAMLGRQTHSNGISRDALEPRPPPPAYTPQQTVLSAATVGFPGQQPLKSGDKEHLYSTVCKPKSPKVKEQPTFSSSSVLGGGLCELDRLLQELNATQFNITDEIMSQFPNEKGKEVVKTKEPPAAASAKLSAGPTSRGMESMPVSESSMRGEEVTPRAAQDGSAGGRAVPQTPARPSATSATLELDKLMASLSDFKVQSNTTIEQMKGSPKVHHVFREETPRKRLGPLLIQRSEEKDQLIGELHGRLGIVKCLELERKVEEDWLTEGVVVTSEPLRKEKLPEEEGTHKVPKIVAKKLYRIAPMSPALQSNREPLKPIQRAASPPKTLVPTSLLQPPLLCSPSNDSLGPSPSFIPFPSSISTASLPLEQPPISSSSSWFPVAQNPVSVSCLSVGCQVDDFLFCRDDKIPPYQAAPPPVKVPASQPVVSKPPPPPAGGNLDNMLVMLQSDLSRQGISTVAKGVCAACQKPIAGQVVSALDQTWHPEHFVCAHCQREMGGSNFFEKDGLPYCERDYFQLFSPRCGLCNEPILDVSHPGGKWALGTQRNMVMPLFETVCQCEQFGLIDFVNVLPHRENFSLGFHEKDGKQYCRQDFYEMFATRCKGCTSAILENYISALNALWHPECFVCRECYTPFVNGSFFEHEGQPYCEIHYHKHRGSLCSGCEKPITGRCITAMGKKFHPEHFVCAFCLKQLNKGTFKEQNEKPYCHGCFIKLFG
nr:PREDICTED: transforming growth factor beta-1-induced transcript 1 protein [Latimeria chalumnae]|eukprot:XP_014346817.1 PREDICTED: transforming growth factor beta-1-induced transcript 1 protein [Latimeria chalumnae]